MPVEKPTHRWEHSAHFRKRTDGAVSVQCKHCGIVAMYAAVVSGPVEKQVIKPRLCWLVPEGDDLSQDVKGVSFEPLPACKDLLP